MAQFNYQDIREVYETLLNENEVFYPIIGVKAVALILVTISFYNKYLQSMKPDDAGNKTPITAWDIAKAIILVSLVIGYDQVLNVLDGALGSIENQYVTDGSTGVNLNDVSNTTVTKPEANDSWTDAMKAMAKAFNDFINDPLIIVLWIVKGIAWLFTALAYGVYIAERFFFLGLLRVFGGLALACLAIKQIEKWFWSWLGLYVSIYLVIIPYFLIEKFTSVVHDKFMMKFRMFDATVGMPGQPGSASILGALLIIFLAFLQLKLYKRSGEIVMKIFG
jgi:hypothetical protein